MSYPWLRGFGSSWGAFFPELKNEDGKFETGHPWEILQ